MKKIILCLLLCISLAPAQNLQTHYDMGEGRDYVTTTLEMFKPDALGSTFWFVDMDYNSSKNAMSLGYWEISRYFALPVLNNSLSATIQYNDGLMLAGETDEVGIQFGSVWLAGLSYFVPLGESSFSVDLLYRRMDISAQPDWQFTLVWFHPLLNGRVHFMGYLDYYSQDDFSGNKLNIFQAEPQLWWNLNGHIAVGSEVEISQNFLPQFGDAWKFMPTIAVKWTF